MPDPRLTISIPTYERADILEENLRGMAPALCRVGIPVFIFDDSRSDTTAQAVDRLREIEGLDLRYLRNTPPLGHDANVLKALTAPQCQHVWLLGDSLYAAPEDIEEICRRLNDQDLVFLNGRDGAQTSDETRLTGHDGSLSGFLTRHTWHLTMTGVTIYSARVVAWWRRTNHSVYRNFPQLSVFLGFAAEERNARAEWIGRRIVHGNSRKVSYWLKQAIQTFGVDWESVIRGNASAFSAGSLKAVLASHSVHSGVLGPMHLLSLRASGELPLSVVRANWRVLTACSSAPAWLLALISVAPPRLLSFARSVRRKTGTDAAA